MQKGGVCIYVNNSIIHSCLNLEAYCNDGEIEVCGVKFQFQGKEIYVLTIYRPPSGNFSNFLKQLENILYSLFKPKNDLIICGDLNVNYLEVSNRVKQLNTLLKTFNLVNVITFPTRIYGHTTSSIDNVFIDTTRFNSFTVSPIYNGLSDHDGQVLTLVLPPTHKRAQQTYTYRKINTDTIADFLNLLSYENWD
jgi:exonuclease III